MNNLQRMGSLIYLILLFFLPAMAVAEQLISVQDRLDGLLAEAHESCADDGGVLELSGDEVVQYDFDNNGSTDLTILNEIDYKCSSSASLFQGTAGAIIHLMTDKDYFSGYAREVQLVNAFNNKQIILLGLHGSSCGEAGNIICVDALTLHEGRIITVKGE
jgi:hypothetical protein